MLTSGEANTLVLNVRDPVDRFVWAFNWRTILLCKPDDDRTSRENAREDPLRQCRMPSDGNKIEENAEGDV